MLSQLFRKAIMMVAIFVYLGVCAVLLRGLRFDSKLSLDMSNDVHYQQMLEVEALLPQPDPLLILQPCAQSAFSAESIEALVRLVDFLNEESSRAGMDGWSVRSILGESIPVMEEDSIIFKELFTYAGDGQSLKRALDDYPTLGRLFYPGNDAWIVYLYPEGEEDQLFIALESAQKLFPEIIVSGRLWLMYQSMKIFKRDLMVIIPLSIIIIFLVFVIFEKAGSRSILLTLASVLPAMGNIAMYPLFGYNLKISTVMAPLLVLSLSTTYVIHVHHHYRTGNNTLASFFKERGKVIFWSGITTLLGFASLILSPIDDIRTNGIFILLGLVVAFLWDLFLLPLYLSSNNINVVSVHPVPEEKRLVNGTHKNRYRAGIIGFLLVAATGIVHLKASAIPIDDFFVGSQPFDIGIERFKEFVPLTNEVIVYVDSGIEGGIVDPEFFTRSKSCALAVQKIPGLRSVYTYTDIVTELSRALSYPPDALDSEASIGELLELVPIDSDSPRLYDLAYRLAVFKINLDADMDSISLSTDRTQAMRALFAEYFDESTIKVAGTWPRLEVSIVGLAKGQIAGLALYFGVVFSLLAFFLRSPLKSLVVCAPPAVAILASAGLCGYIGWELTPTLSIALAAIAGVGIDDAILWSFYSHHPAMKRSVSSTTILLVCGLSPLLLSYHMDLIHCVIAVMIGFILSTLIVLKVLPWQEE